MSDEHPPILLIILMLPFLVIGCFWLSWHFIVTFIPWWADRVIDFTALVWSTL